MKKILKSCLSFLLVFSMLFMNMEILTNAAGSAETLIQRANETGTQVDGSSKTDFTISVNRGDDEFDVYKIAEMTWNDTANGGAGSFNEAAWVAPVAAWIATSAYSAYTTPELLAKENESVTIAMLRQLQKDMEADSTLKTNMETYKIAYHTGSDYSAESSDNVTASTATDESTSAVTFLNEYTVNDVDFGLYFVDAKNSVAARTYQPVLADIAPVQTGPTGNWYFGDPVAVTLKYQDVIINKYINPTTEDPDRKTDIVRKGEVVSFEIDSQIPQYPSDAGTHTLYLNDDMAGGFTLDADSIKLEFSTDDGTSWTEVPTAGYYKMTVAADANVYKVTAAGGTETEFAFAVDNATNYTYYTIKEGNMVSLGNYADTSDAWSQVLSIYNTNMGTSLSGTVSKLDEKKTVINFSFDYDKMMTDLKPTDIKLTYTATVNGNMSIGSDDNTNEADLYYVEDSAGNTNVVTDIVKAWTYAVNIVKVDGDTVDEAAPAYLANAEFDLYRRTDTYCAGTSSAGTEEADYVSYTWFSNQDGLATYTDAGMAEKLSEVTGTSIYKVPVKVASCKNNAGEHYHIEVFQKFNENSIVSTGDENGITFEGLDPNAYLLVETKAPDGYNLLTEAVRFEINKYTDDEYTAAGNTYKGFVGDDSVNRTDGIYPVEVMNFKGITLPSTGGMGTWLFTIIGVSVMLAAMLFVIISRRKRNADEC